MTNLRKADIAAPSKVLGGASAARRAEGLGHPLQCALDWLSDGVALVDADRRMLYANDAFLAIANQGESGAIKVAIDQR